MTAGTAGRDGRSGLRFLGDALRVGDGAFGGYEIRFRAFERLTREADTFLRVFELARGGFETRIGFPLQAFLFLPAIGSVIDGGRA